MQENSNNLASIASKVKKMVIFLGILLFLGVTFLIIALVLKSSKSTTSTLHNSHRQKGVGSTEQNISLFPKNCSPISIIYKENYIALTSKKCALTKIINPNGKVSSYHY